MLFFVSIYTLLFYVIKIDVLSLFAYSSFFNDFKFELYQCTQVI